MAQRNQAGRPNAHIAQTTPGRRNRETAALAHGKVASGMSSLFAKIAPC